MKVALLITSSLLAVPCRVSALQSPLSRRQTFEIVACASQGLLVASEARAETPETFDVDNYLKTGFVQMPMGVSGQAGKSKPETGVVLSDGYEVNRSKQTGDVLAEILVKSKDGQLTPVLVSFQSPWPLATGTVFDVECKNDQGDDAFLAVTSRLHGKALADMKDSFFVDQLFAPTGRFSFYGQPTDVKVKTSNSNGTVRELEISFSTLSQSTQTEIPRRAKVVAMLPDGTDQAVLLVGSSSTLRWKKGIDKQVDAVSDSFSAIPAPQTSMKVRAKERRGV